MAVFSPNSELIATASNDGIVRLFDLGGSEEPKKPKRFAGIGKATGVDFSPNGDLLVSSSNTGEARVWNSDGDGETLVIYSVPRSMNSAEFGPSDGPAAYRILTTSDDGAVRLWRYRWKDLVAAIDESTQLCLTVEDRINYLREERKEAECGIKECKRRKKNNLAGKGDRVPPMDTNIFSSIRNLFGPSRVECDSKTDTAKGK